MIIPNANHIIKLWILLKSWDETDGLVYAIFLNGYVLNLETRLSDND